MKPLPEGLPYLNEGGAFSNPAHEARIGNRANKIKIGSSIRLIAGQSFDAPLLVILVMYKHSSITQESAIQGSRASVYSIKCWSMNEGTDVAWEKKGGQVA